MKKVFLLLVLFAMGCEENAIEPENSNTILGKWVLNKKIYFHYDGSSVSSWEDNYHNIGGIYLNANFIELNGNNMIMYYNAPHESTYESGGTEYTLVNDTIKFTWNNYEISKPFYLSNDTLIYEVMASYDNTGELSEI